MAQCENLPVDPPGSWQEPVADLNAEGLINFFDVSDFLAEFSAGCR
jgi:hypothetical protein